MLRRLVTAGDEIATSALNPAGRDTKQILDDAESRVFRIAEEGARGRQGFIEIQPLLTKVVERIQELFERANPSDVTGVPTGFADLDSKTSGFQPGDLIIIAGRPSMGKTALALNIGEHVAHRPGHAGGGVLDGNGRLAAGAAHVVARSAGSTSSGCAPGACTTTTGRA